MGFRFRWSKRILPGIRLNLSKSGPSVSLGGRGFWFTVGSKGTRTTVGIPGTGMSWSSYKPYSSGKQPSASAPAPEPAPAFGRSEDQIIDSAPLDAIAAGSNNDLAPLLQEVQRRWRYEPLIVVLCILFFVLGFFFSNNEWIVLSAITLVAGWPIAKLSDHFRRSLKVTYNLQGQLKSDFDLIVSDFEKIRSAKRSWHIPSQNFTSDWKRNAGAGILIKRKRIYPDLKQPFGIRANLRIPTFQVGSQSIQFGPNSIFISAANRTVILNYDDVEVSASNLCHPMQLLSIKLGGTRTRAEALTGGSITTSKFQFACIRKLIFALRAD